MKVAVNAIGLAPGGGLTLLLNQTRRFEALDPFWHFTYFTSPRCAGPLGDAVERGTVVVPFSRQPGYAARFAWEQLRFPRLLHAGRYDVLYGVGNYAVFRAGIPQLILDHNPWHFAGVRELGFGTEWALARIKRAFARASVRRADAVVYLSRAFAAAMTSVGFPPPTRIIPSGVSVDLPTSSSAELPVACDRCRHGGYALAVHNWYPHKRLSWLASTWASTSFLRTRHLVVVGRALNKAARRELSSIEPALGTRECVHIVDGASREQVARLYLQADLYVSASVLEAFPLTPFEAMRFSVPCVLSDIPPHREVADSAACYFEVGDVNSLASAVATAGRTRSELIERGRDRLLEFSWEQNVEALLEELTAIVRRSVMRPSRPPMAV